LTAQDESGGTGARQSLLNDLNDSDLDEEMIDQADQFASQNQILSRYGVGTLDGDEEGMDKTSRFDDDMSGEEVDGGILLHLVFISLFSSKI
jgi:hypothetical protein